MPSADPQTSQTTPPSTLAGALAEAEEAPTPPRRPPSAFEPLSAPAFRLLWSTWLGANLVMWMNDVAAAWTMSTLTRTPIWVALVQAASTLPVFLLGLPSGALADILDRRRWLVFTQIWLAVTAIVLSVATWAGWMSIPLLLVLVFANGVGLAMRWPVFAAIVPELVPREQLPAALALNGMSMNLSRIVGPLVAGALIASAGTQWVFALNAVLSVASAVVVLRWRPDPAPRSPLGRERLFGAMRVGVQFVRQSARMRAVLVRVSIFFLHSTALVALLPLLARGLAGGDAGTFTLLLACMGAGAIGGVLALPRLRQAHGRDRLVVVGTVVQSAATAVMAIAPSVWIAVPAMVAAGLAWITVANSLSVSAQMSLPSWVRARGIAAFQMAIMGSSALGAALWGQVATVGSMQTALLSAAASGTLLMMIAVRFIIDSGEEVDTSPARTDWAAGPTLAPNEEGRIVTTIEYRIDPERAEAFLSLMRETRRARLSEGAIGWHLNHDVADPARYVEEIVDESWTEHLRRFHRATLADVVLRERRLAFHQQEAPPVVTRYVEQR